MLEVGSVFKKEYFLFSGNRYSKHFENRPCVIIHQNEDSVYYLPLSHSSSRAPFGDFYIDKKDIVILTNIYRGKHFGAKEIFYIEEPCMFSLLSALYIYQENFKSHDPDYHAIRSDLLNTISSLSPKQRTRAKK